MSPFNLYAYAVSPRSLVPFHITIYYRRLLGHSIHVTELCPKFCTSSLDKKRVLNCFNCQFTKMPLNFSLLTGVTDPDSGVYSGYDPDAGQLLSDPDLF